MKKGIVLTLTSVVLAALLLAGCAQAPAASRGPGITPASGEEATSDKNIVFNKSKKEVTILAEVNGKYFTEPTRHGVVFASGSNGEKSVLRGLGDEKVFYQAMVDAGFEPSNKLTMDDMKKGVRVVGEKLDVYVAWDDKEVVFADIIKSGDERSMDIRFGGNIENAKKADTGCILCLDSCAVGITSNASYETGASDTTDFFGVEGVLPADGTLVKVIFRARG